MLFDCIVVASHLRFDGVRQRPHHIVSRLARRVPVLVVEEPFLAERDRNEIDPDAAPNVAVHRPLRSSLAASMFDVATLALVREWVGARRPLLWAYTPLAEPLANAFPEARLVYDRMDDLAAFAFAAPGLAQRERTMLARAAVVFAGGRTLLERSLADAPHARLFASGVDFEHFAGARDARPPDLFAHLSAPVCGYAGVIDERIDFDALEALAGRPVEIVLVGPVTKIDGSQLPRRPNVHFTGPVPYAALPSYLAGFDVALLPFAHNAATAAISPTKTPEYLAAGLPVVSTGIADVVADYGDIATFADDPQEFAAACVAALVPDALRSERGLERARSAGWDAIVERMWSVVEGE